MHVTLFAANLIGIVCVIGCGGAPATPTPAPLTPAELASKVIEESGNFVAYGQDPAGKPRNLVILQNGTLRPENVHHVANVPDVYQLTVKVGVVEDGDLQILRSEKLRQSLQFLWLRNNKGRSFSDNGVRY